MSPSEQLTLAVTSDCPRHSLTPPDAAVHGPSSPLLVTVAAAAASSTTAAAAHLHRCQEPRASRVRGVILQTSTPSHSAAFLPDSLLSDRRRVAECRGSWPCIARHSETTRHNEILETQRDTPRLSALGQTSCRRVSRQLAVYSSTQRDNETHSEILETQRDTGDPTRY